MSHLLCTQTRVYILCATTYTCQQALWGLTAGTWMNEWIHNCIVEQGKNNHLTLLAQPQLVTFLIATLLYFSLNVFTIVHFIAAPQSEARINHCKLILLQFKGLSFKREAILRKQHIVMCDTCCIEQSTQAFRSSSRPFTHRLQHLMCY